MGHKPSYIIIITHIHVYTLNPMESNHRDGCPAGNEN